MVEVTQTRKFLVRAVLLLLLAIVSIRLFAQVPKILPSVEVSGYSQKNGPDENETLAINRCFNLGNRGGYHDRNHSDHRARGGKCDFADSSNAYTLGYQQGLTGNRNYRRDHPLSNWARTRGAQ